MQLNITNRDLLRNYRQFKERLLRGEVQCLKIEQSDGQVISVRVEQPGQTAFEKMTAQIKQKPLSFLKRPEADIFDPI